MKKIRYILLIGAVSLLLVAASESNSVFAQKPSKGEKAAGQTENKISEREKFDPGRNAAEDLQQAIIKAREKNKRIILDVGGEWCVWCVWMDEYFIKNPDIAKLRDENFVWLKVNMSPENENTEFLAKYPEITAYPHLFVLETDGTFLHSQDTAVLEAKRSYDKQKFTEFLTKWSPVKKQEKTEK